MSLQRGLAGLKIRAAGRSVGMIRQLSQVYHKDPCAGEANTLLCSLNSLSSRVLA